MNEVDKKHQAVALEEYIKNTVVNYLQSQDAKSITNLHQLIMEEVEIPLFRAAMEYARYNQSRAARLLGISRGTLRTKLKTYFDDEFIGTR